MNAVNAVYAMAGKRRKDLVTVAGQKCRVNDIFGVSHGSYQQSKFEIYPSEKLGKRSNCWVFMDYTVNVVSIINNRI